MEKQKKNSILLFLESLYIAIDVYIEHLWESIKEKRKINKIIKKDLTQLSREEKEILVKNMREKLNEIVFKLYLKIDSQNHNLSDIYYRLQQTKEKLINDIALTPLDCQLIRFLYQKETIETIPYRSQGMITFLLEEPYLSIVKERIKSHYFMNFWIEMESDTNIRIHNWQRDEKDLFDLFCFLSTYGMIHFFSFTFYPDEEKMKEVLFVDNKLFLVFKNNEKEELVSKDGFLMNLEIDASEKRTLSTLNGNIIPLMNEFMVQKERNKENRIISDWKQVQLEDGTRTTVCSQCIFRTRQITQNGCWECKPKKTEKR